MYSIPGYDHWLTIPPEDQYDGPICPFCEVELFAGNTCECGEYCIGCCPTCESVKKCSECGSVLTKDVPACDCGEGHCSYCHESVSQ